MSSHPELALAASLTFSDDLGLLLREGLDLDVIPTEGIRRMVDWALRYYVRSGHQMAPSEEAFRLEFGALIDDLEVKLGYPEDSCEWAVDKLKAQYLVAEFQRSIKMAAVNMAESDDEGRTQVIEDTVQSMLDLSRSVQPHNAYVELMDGVDTSILHYERRLLTQGTHDGASLGLPQLDDHFYGVHGGEVLVLAAPPKTGKSFMLARWALEEWKKGRNPVLFTLENSVQMTIDRIVCMACGIDPRDYQRGQVHPQMMDMVRQWREAIEMADNTIHVIQPEPGKRNVDRMVQECVMREGDTLLIDQLTFVEPPDHRKSRPNQIADIMHDLKAAVSSTRVPLPTFLAHQINREGVKMADKVGYLRMDFLAEGSEVERTADFVLGLYQTEDDKVVRQAKIQTLAARRTDYKHWRISWDVERSLYRCLGEFSIADLTSAA